MSRRSEHARSVVACGVLLGTLELLSIAAAARWPTVDAAQPEMQRAVPDAVTGEWAERTGDAADVDETEASMLFAEQLLARLDGALDAARLDAAWAASSRAHSSYDRRFCATARDCD
jgi:hypothetical protein